MAGNHAGLCSRIHSWSASLMRLCQPLPVDLNIARISLSSLSVVFALLEPTGRPRRAFLNVWSNSSRETTLPPIIGVAFLKNSSVNSGASSELTQGFEVSISFAFIGVPHRDYADSVAALSPDQNDNSTIQLSESQESDFSVVESGVTFRQYRAVEDFLAKSSPRSCMVASRLLWPYSVSICLT